MHWIALLPSRKDEAVAWAWHALQFTPRVAWAEGRALVLEVQASERLFGGRGRLLRRLLCPPAPGLALAAWAQGATSAIALCLLRLAQAGEAPPARIPDDLPLAAFAPVQDCLATLERIGCRTWGQLHALPRAGVSRRFGAAVLQALDRAWGTQPETHAWITLPPVFDQVLELPALATSAPELLPAAQRLLALLQAWLQARHLGVLALELAWTLDLRRLDGRPLPPSEALVLRTAQATQDVRHLRRLAAEQLARTAIAAPASALRLRTLETAPWGGATTSLLPEERRPGERLHELVERLSARLGEGRVRVPRFAEDHRPERMQAWVPAARVRGRGGAAALRPDALYPAWVLREPLRLAVRGDKPWYQGPLQLVTRASRLEAAWWDPQEAGPVLRDYFVARSEGAGLLWVFRERLAARQGEARWFLHGIYA